ncbi:unnamed protein product [Allacma fusca]|uniref:Uncharacterized protein n=1 Tax=Allacma fusca TaxID=39272 RepID=A0A8J2PUI6_9HEXA|nr:unnamed protein product [Allacma fusca]
MKLQGILRVFLVVSIISIIKARHVQLQDQNSPALQLLEISAQRVLPEGQTHLVPLEIAIRHVPSFKLRNNNNHRNKLHSIESKHPNKKYLEEFDTDLIGK